MTQQLQDKVITSLLPEFSYTPNGSLASAYIQMKPNYQKNQDRRHLEKKISIHDLTLENGIVLGKIDRTDQEIKCR